MSHKRAGRLNETAEIARVYRVCKSTVYNLLQLARKTGSTEPRPHAYGRRPALNGTQMQRLESLIEERRDITLKKIQEEMDLGISLSALSHIIPNKLGHRYKRKNKTGRTLFARRKAWKEARPLADISKLVFLDESGANTNMTRRYAQARKGLRTTDAVPLNKSVSTAMLSSIRADGSAIPIIFQGTLNRETFKKYLKGFGVPVLKPGNIVIVDNLRCHKGGGIAKLAASAGASSICLPPYSHDLHPIEQMWSKIKACC